MTTTSIENHTLARLLDAWDTTVLPKHHDGAMQEWMESLRHEFMTCKQNAMNELTNDQLHDIWLKTSPEEWDFARAVIAADRAQQAARHAEELLAYEVTVGNLRAEPALTCDFCGCDTQDPWHGSTATNRHVHACDMCRPKLAQPQGEPVAAAGEDLGIYQSIADNYFKSIRPAHTEAEAQEIFNAAQQAFNPTNYGYHQRDFGNVVRRILGVPAP